MKMGTKTNEGYLRNLMLFLNSNYFQQPVLQFMERNCHAYNPTEMENPEYGRIHQKYRILIDLLLDGHEDEFGLMDGQLIDAVKDMNARIIAECIDKEVYRFMHSADDVVLFMQMMLDKNVSFREDALSLLIKYETTIPNNILSDQTSQRKPLSTTKDELIKRLLDVLTKEDNYIMEGESPTKQAQKRNALKQQQEKVLILNGKERKRILLESLHELNRPRTMKAAAATLEPNWEAISNDKEPSKEKLRKAIAKRLQTEILVRTT